MVVAPAAFALGGEGLLGETTDSDVTWAGLALIVFFPLFVGFASLLQGHLEKRKHALPARPEGARAKRRLARQLVKRAPPRARGEAARAVARLGFRGRRRMVSGRGTVQHGY